MLDNVSTENFKHHQVKFSQSDDDVVYGCRETDFKGDYAGKIAVLFRGVCEIEKKIENAALKNATGVVVINNNPEGVITMSIGGN